MLAPETFARTVVRGAYSGESAEFQEAAHKLLKEAWKVASDDPESTVNQTIRDGSSRYLHSKVISYCYAAALHVRDTCSVRELCQEVADDEDVDEKTAWKWLCERNPIYETGAGSETERYDRLSAAILCVLRFTETP